MAGSTESMMPTQGDDRQRVLDATDIVRLIGDHLTLRAKGREYVGLCPFHDDHKPSMTVVPAKQMYKCFSCGAGGNAITFVREYHKMSFREALEYLAERAGIKLTPWRPRSGMFAEGDAGEVDTSGRAGLLAANLTARDFFRAVLAHAEHGRVGREIIARRGISPEMVELFELGLAPNRWDGLTETIARKNLSVGPFVAGGLLKSREEGSAGGVGGRGQYDFFRNRLMFPIHDQIGRVIAFGGRRINEEDEPKYINSAESMVFNKSATLYGLNQAAQEIRRARVAIVTEGYMDTIACHQAGVKNAVATLGTALTRESARVLRRLCDTVVLLFDGDEAGQKAADRALEVFFAEPIDVKIAVLSSIRERTGAKDPDELLKQEGGRELFDEMIASAVGAIEFRFTRLRAKLEGLGLSARSRLVEEDLARLVDIGLEDVAPIRKQLIIKQIASVVGVDERTVVAAIPKRRRAFGVGGAPTASGATASPAESKRPSTLTVREHLLGCIMCDPALMMTLESRAAAVIDPTSFEQGPLKAVSSAIHQLASTGAAPDLRNVLGVLTDLSAQRVAIALEAEVSRMTDDSVERVQAHWRDRLAEALRQSAWGKLAASGQIDEPDEDGWSTEEAAPPASSEVSGLEAIVRLKAKVGNNRASVPKPLGG